jgi:hypothetical protein
MQISLLTHLRNRTQTLITPLTNDKRKYYCFRNMPETIPRIMRYGKF